MHIPAMAAEFADAHAALDPGDQRLALAILRLLAEGEPVGATKLAERVAITPAEAASHLDRLPALQRDDRGRVRAYAGLTLEPTSHALELDGRTLHAWCALDALFLPELLARPARIRSTCPQTRTQISLSVDADGAHEIAPEGTAMTLHTAAGFDQHDVIRTFCCHVHFFASEQAAREWARRSEGTYVVSIAEGYEYGRVYNHARFGAALASRPQ